MTATCREACCSVQPRLTTSELFERGYRRNRAPALSIEGTQQTDADGNNARFSLDTANGKILGVGFRATTCATLIAYCEYIAEVVPGFRLEIAAALTAAQLVDSVPGVPLLKHDRAVLAITAFRASLAAALQPIATEEARNESRLHLRHPAPQRLLCARQDDPAAVGREPARRRRGRHVLLRG
jgi:NifU-like protein involved in Fe-S cluster formation